MSTRVTDIREKNGAMDSGQSRMFDHRRPQKQSYRSPWLSDQLRRVNVYANAGVNVLALL